MSKKKKSRQRDDASKDQKKDYSKYYLRIVKAGIVAALFLPLLIVPSHLYIMQFGKVVVFRTIIEIIAFFYVLLIIDKAEYRPKWGLLEISISLFIVIYFLTSVTGVNFWRSFWGTIERMGGFFTLLHLWAYFIVLTSVFKSRKEWRYLFNVSVLVVVASSLYGFGQSVYFPKFLEWLKSSNTFFYNILNGYSDADFFIIKNELRPYGTIGNAGLFTGYVLFNLFFGLYIFVSSKAIYKKLSSFILILFLFFTLVIAGSRSSFLAVIAGLFVSVLVFALSSGKRKSKAVFAVLLIILTSGSLFVWTNKNNDWVKNDKILARLTDISLESDETRIMTWESSWQGFGDKPLLGAGPENFNVMFNKYFNPLHFQDYGSASWYDRAHNIFLDLLVTMGAVGFLSYLGIFAAIYLFLFKNLRRAHENLAAFALIFSFPVAYFVQNMFWFDDFSIYLMLFLFLAFASNFFNEELKFEYNIERGKKITDFINKKINFRKIGYWILNNKNTAIGIVGIILATTIYYANIKPWVFQNTFTITVAAFGKNTEASFDWYKKAIKESTYLGRQELYKKFGDYVNGAYRFKVPKDEFELASFKANIDYAVSEMRNAVAENPNDVQFYLLLGRMQNTRYSLFRDQNSISDAEKTLRKAMELSPSRETVYYELGQTLVFKKDYKGAIETFQKAVDLNPEVAISHWYLGMAYANAGDLMKAKEETDKALVLGYNYGKNIDDIIGLTPIYLELKDYKTLEDLYNRALALEPNNTQFYVSLGLVYKELGDKENSRKMIEKAISLDPALAAEGNAFLESLK